MVLMLGSERRVLSGGGTGRYRTSLVREEGSGVKWGLVQAGEDMGLQDLGAGTWA